MSDVERPVYRDGLLHVMSEQCATCVGRPGNLMHLAPGRLKEIVETNIANGAALPCHDTTYGQDERGEALCRWFFDTYREHVLALQLAVVLDIVAEVEPRASDGA